MRAVEEASRDKPTRRAGSRGATRGASEARRAQVEKWGAIIAKGHAVGGQIVTGPARFIASVDDVGQLRAGEILLANETSPKWLPAMQIAAAIVTNVGGRGSHAGRVARRLGVPAVVGTVDGASRIWSGAILTVACDGGDVGVVYETDPSAKTSPGGPDARS